LKVFIYKGCYGSPSLAQVKYLFNKSRESDRPGFIAVVKFLTFISLIQISLILVIIYNHLIKIIF